MFIFNISVIFVFLTTVVVTKALEHDDGNGRDNSLDLIPSRFPFLVGVISSTFDDDHIVCTGTLITLDFVLTSAFCALRLKPEIKVSAQFSVNNSVDEGGKNMFLRSLRAVLKIVWMINSSVRNKRNYKSV